MWSLFAALGTGMVGLFQKIHQSSSEHSAEMAAMLISCFVTSLVVSFVCYLYELAKEKEKLIISIEPISAICGIANAVSHSINIFLVGILPAVIIFPIVNLVPMILLMLSAVIIFREKLSKKRWLGIFVGLLSTVFLSGIIK